MFIKKKSLGSKGQSLVEYLVLLAVVVLGVIVGMTFFKNTVANAFNETGNGMNARVVCEMGALGRVSQEEP